MLSREELKLLKNIVSYLEAGAENPTNLYRGLCKEYAEKLETLRLKLSSERAREIRGE